MRENRTKKKIDGGGVAYGTFTELSDPAIVEILGAVGYDYTIIDLEHSALSLADAENLARAARAAGITPLARIPHDDVNAVMRLVGSGIEGILAPRIRNAADARRIVDAAMYAPIGTRGCDAMRRAVNYGLDDYAEHITRSNQELMILLLIEEKEALDHLDEIFAIPGLYGAYIGPGDLAQSMGIPGEYQHPLVQEAIREATAAIKRHGLKLGRVALVEGAARKAIDDGASMISTPVTDSYFIAHAFRNHLNRVKQE